ncbi:hypothetical protein BDZ91DRAFT_754537 [Kalaharituber pfeilii]|nr:hypothetical protein BDZ91DRAFT_754537 [Kalaharituber pfeilii]
MTQEFVLQGFQVVGGRGLVSLPLLVIGGGEVRDIREGLSGLVRSLLRSFLQLLSSLVCCLPEGCHFRCFFVGLCHLL